MVRIPFDCVVLSAVLDEVRPYVGGLVQGVRQPDEHTIHVGLYRGGIEERDSRGAMLLFSCDPAFYRVHLTTRRAGNPAQPPGFCAALRARIDGGTLLAATQIAADRIAVLEFESSKGRHTLIAELMGKHSNLILIDEERKIVSAAKWVSRDKSTRPILPNARYHLPPVVDQGHALEPSPVLPLEWLGLAKRSPERLSPFYRKLAASGGLDGQVSWSAHLASGQGAYPLDLSALGIESLNRDSISIALEQHYAVAVVTDRADSLRAQLTGRLSRVLLARDTAIADLEQTLSQGARAPTWQRYGELILAYGGSLPEDASKLDAWDYDGSPVSVRLDPELDFKANAAEYFDRAKRAKGRTGQVQEQIVHLLRDRAELEAVLSRARETIRLTELEDLQEECRKRRWLTEQPAGKAKEDRPYEGHRIRELVGPGGITVLYGENAESNDYLTLRVAKPNDMWLHIRGSTSAHVVIVTGNHPERISQEHLMFAAKVAVQNSPSKHAGFVPVDYTLKRYVRRAHGAPKGTALYTHEKTLHVGGDG